MTKKNNEKKLVKKDKLNSTEVVKSSNNLDKIENKEKIKECKAKYKEELLKLKNKNRAILNGIVKNNKEKLKSIKDKKERTKVRFEQYADLHEQEDELFYSEYLLEVKQKDELEKMVGTKTKLNGNTLVDADATSGNAFLNYFKLLFRDIKVSIVEKPRIAFGIFTMITGILIGFSIDVFITISFNFSSDYSYIGLIVFVFEILGMLNIVNGFRICGEGRLKSVVSAFICSIGELIAGGAWIYLVSTSMLGTSASTGEIFQTFIVTIICIITAFIGSIGGFFTYDKEYVKEIR